MAPAPSGTAACMIWPRKRTRRTAASNGSASAHTSAVNSPRLWPATAAGAAPPCSRQTRQVATPAASIAGCVNSVLLSRCAGPAATSSHRSKPSAAEACAKHCAHRADAAAANAASMPTDCDPWPGNTSANDMLTRTHGSKKARAIIAASRAAAAAKRRAGRRARRTGAHPARSGRSGSMQARAAILLIGELDDQQQQQRGAQAVAAAIQARARRQRAVQHAGGTQVPLTAGRRNHSPASMPPAAQHRIQGQRRGVNSRANSTHSSTSPAQLSSACSPAQMHQVRAEQAPPLQLRQRARARSAAARAPPDLPAHGAEQQRPARRAVPAP